MSGETEQNISGWTVDTLHSYMLTRFTELTKQLDERKVAQEFAINAALLSAKEAVLKAEIATEKRFEGVNEFRQSLNDQQALFMPREVSDAQISELRKQIAALTTRLDRSVGKEAGTKQIIGYMFAAATVIISIVIFIANILTKKN